MSIEVTASQLPPANGIPLGSGPGAIVGAVVIVVVVLVVGSVVVAAVLIAWRVRNSGKKAFTGKHSDGVLYLLSMACMSCLRDHVPVALY